MKRWLKRSLWGTAAVLLVAILAVAWLGGSQGGLRFALNQVRGALGDKLSVGSVEGTLFGGMRLRDVRYHDPDVGDYRLGLIEVAPRSRRLFTGELHLTAVTVHDVDITLGPPGEEPASTEPFKLPVLDAPLAMRIDALLVRGIDVRQHDGTPVVAINSVDGRARWIGAQLDIEQLDLQLPEGSVGVVADIDTAADWAGDADLAFNVQLADQPAPLAGTARVSGPQDKPVVHVSLAQPSPATLDLDWPGALPSRWRLRAHADAFALDGVVAEPPISRLAFDLDGEGDLESAALSGQIALDGYGLVLDGLSVQRTDAGLRIERLAVAEAAGPGRVDASGELDLAGDVPVGRLDARWQDINPPLEAPFDQLAASGHIEANGTLDALQARVAAKAMVNAQPVELTLEAAGDPQGELRIAPLTLVTGNGQLDADGRVTLAPAITWQARVQTRRFNPGLLLPDWSGNIDMDAETSGRLPSAQEPADALAARVNISRLGGRLRDRPLGGGGVIELAGDGNARSDLSIRLGDNLVRIDGRVGNDLDARVRATLSDPAAFLPDASGRLDVDLTARGSWPTLAVEGRIDGDEVVMADVRVEHMELAVNARTDFSGDNRLQADIRGLQLAGQTIATLAVTAGGNEADNRLTVEADTEQGRARLAMAGAYARADERWSGHIELLELASPQLPETLALRERTAVVLSADAVTLAPACLDGGGMQLCLDADWAAATGGEVGFDLARLPLGWLLAMTGDDSLEASGELGGRGRLRFDADLRTTGQILVEGTPGRVGFRADESIDESGSELVAWTRLDGQVELTGDRRGVDVNLELSPAGSLRLQAGTVTTDDGVAPLDGELVIDLPDLSLLALLTPELVNPVGAVRGRMQLSGTLDAPQAQGRIELTGFGSEIPAAGLRLRDSTVNVIAASDGRLTLDGEVRTGDDGSLRIGGWLGPLAGETLPMEITLAGEHVLAADIPAARVFVSPDLRIVNNARGLRVLGSVAVPQAMIRPDLLEGGATPPSPDVHIAGTDEVDVATTGLPVFANVEVTLGDRVRIEGYGLKGTLGGKLDIRERPNRDTRALGEITVAGTYQAYGQDLDIERGRLLFSGPIGNPGLDIRAIRRIDTVTAGLQVTGNAQRPVLEVYSVPAMDQAEALSYMVLGRPLRQATSSEDQSALGTAATAVSTAGGDLLAKSLGARLGLDDVGVGTSRELGAGALTVGKYLSPRLYLGYGRSLFDGGQLVTLRYRLTEHFELEAQSGTRDNKAGINYRHER